MAAIRLLVDENLTPLLAEVLASHGYDAVSVRSAGLPGTRDPELLAWAVRNRRAILTNNARHFLPLAQDLVRRGSEHFGIIVTDRVPFRILLARTLRFLSRRQEEDLMNSVDWLQNYRSA